MLGHVWLGLDRQHRAQVAPSIDDRPRCAAFHDSKSVHNVGANVWAADKRRVSVCDTTGAAPVAKARHMPPLVFRQPIQAHRATPGAKSIHSHYIQALERVGGVPLRVFVILFNFARRTQIELYARHFDAKHHVRHVIVLVIMCRPTLMGGLVAARRTAGMVSEGRGILAAKIG